MKIESQVVSLELSKRLKELGVKQESLFFWNEHETKTGCTYTLDYLKREITLNESIPAYTVAELGEMLPTGVIDSGSFVAGHRLIYRGDEHIEVEHSESNARAKMLIYLIENNLLTNV